VESRAFETGVDAPNRRAARRHRTAGNEA